MTINDSPNPDFFHNIFFDIKAFASLMPKNGRLIGFDYGTKRIGVALSDLGRRIANPYGILEGNFTKNQAIISGVISKESVVGIVIGYPLMMNGSKGAMAQSAHQFARNLIKSGLDYPIFMQDERLTTAAVEKLMIDQADLTRISQALKKDKISASIILQNALDTINFQY